MVTSFFDLFINNQGVSYPVTPETVKMVGA